MSITQIPELDNLMQEACDRKANMLYLLPDEPPTFRMHDTIQRSDNAPLTAAHIKDIATAAFGDQALKDIGTETGPLSTLYTLPGIIEGQMLVTKASGAFVITIHLLPTSLPDAQKIKIPQAILDAAMLSKGLIIFTGPTGSGKTTSLFSTLDLINSTKTCSICTIEHAMSYHLTAKKALIQQREVGLDVPDMLTGIKTSIWQSADVLMVGELRTLEEINMCLMASQSNLVLTQLHADSPEGALQRLIDVFGENSAAVPRKILAGKLRGICAQILLERADGKGKVATYGVLIPDDQMRKDIAEGKNVLNRSTPLPDSCRSLPEDIESLYQSGIISEEVKNQALNEIRINQT